MSRHEKLEHTSLRFAVGFMTVCFLLFCFYASQQRSSGTKMSAVIQAERSNRNCAEHFSQWVNDIRVNADYCARYLRSNQGTDEQAISFLTDYAIGRLGNYYLAKTQDGKISEATACSSEATPTADSLVNMSISSEYPLLFADNTDSGREVFCAENINSEMLLLIITPVSSFQNAITVPENGWAAITDENGNFLMFVGNSQNTAKEMISSTIEPLAAGKTLILHGPDQSSWVTSVYKIHESASHSLIYSTPVGNQPFPPSPNTLYPIILIVIFFVSLAYFFTVLAFRRKFRFLLKTPEIINDFYRNVSIPMNTALGSQLIAEQHADDSQLVETNIVRTRTALRRICVLIDDLHSQSETFRHPNTRLTTFYPRDILLAAADACYSEPHYQQVTIQTNADSVKNLMVYGDLVNLHHVIFSLLRLSLQHSPDGAFIDTSVSSEHVANGNLLRFSITDPGSKLSTDELCILRQTLETGEFAPQLMPEWSLLKDILPAGHALGGYFTFSFRPREDLTLTYSLTLPDAPNYMPDAEIIVPEKQRVLVISHQASESGMLLDELKLEGAQAQAISSARAAMELFRNSPEGWYQLVIVDADLPDIHRNDLLSAIRCMKRQDVNNLPVCFLAAANAEIRPDLLDDKAVRYMFRPFHQEELHSILCWSADACARSSRLK